MTLVKFTPNKNVFPDIFDNFFGRDLFDLTNVASAGTTLPAINIKESKDSFSVEVAAPGLKKDDFKLRLDNNVLTISSEKEDKIEEKDKEGNYTRREFSYCSFQRSFTLPNTVDPDKISANYTDGILLITIPKKEEAKVKPTRTISIS